ncbi:MAG: hypothetical protein XD77_1540 [Marinimicrobia bacterium 46_47]|nr:MAG: hypothetical protein XD77_1540 [Marinimicrobia bacterium 46_47]KUK91806.1 MAG: hypothetical protein XE04_0810 [Marinimicrobia bacterium 46_43]
MQMTDIKIIENDFCPECLNGVRVKNQKDQPASVLLILGTFLTPSQPLNL